MKKVIVIGSGPGGYYTAIKLAKEGFSVTVIEKKNIGGTCLNVGCIPTKTLLDNLGLLDHFKENALKKKMFSVNGEDIKVNIDSLRKHQSDVISQLQQGLNKLFSKHKINFIVGTAKLTSKNSIQVEDKEGKKQEIQADHIVIATGSSPKSIPTFEIDGLKILNSDHVWNIPEVPNKMLVVGSGPIGIEFARVFNSLGTKVTVCEIEENICPILDKEISENLSRSLKRRGITLKQNYASKQVEKNTNGVLVKFISTKEEKVEEETFDQVLIATGRIPNLKGLGLEEVNIELEKNAFIKVNEKLMTNVENIWAIGDVTKYPQLAHTASYQAKVVSENIVGKNKKFNGDLIPGCIFGYPEVAFVGKNEEQLKEEKIEYKVGKFLFLASGKAKASGLTEGLVKVLMDTGTKKILGAHIMGPEASVIIHEVVVAMQNDLTVEQILDAVHAHPTYSEVLMEALEDCLGECVYL